LERLVPEFQETKRRLVELVAFIKKSVARLHLTPLRDLSLGKIMAVFDAGGFYQVDHLVGRLSSLMRDVEGPARRYWETVKGFEEVWGREARECRDTISEAATLRNDLDYLFGKLIEARYGELVPGEYLTTDQLHDKWIGPRRRGASGAVRKPVILLIDSMRLDIWRQLVKPALERDYAVEESLGLARLPSETRVSRRCLFAGKPPAEVSTSGMESDFLAAELTRFYAVPTSLSKVRAERPGMVFGVETKDKLTYAAVFDFPDRLSHEVDWDPHMLQDALRPLIREVRAVLSQAGTDALVFIAADHGHNRLRGGSPIYLDDADDVGYHAAYVSKKIEGRNAAHVFQIPAKTLGHASPGWYVFPKPGFYLRRAQDTAGRPGAGYRHGGLSLFEVIVPLAVLRHREASTSVYIQAQLRGSAVTAVESRIDVSLSVGPRETGKSYGFKNLSYYSYMLSGGRATPAALFVHGSTGKPGLVAQFDTLVFDEIAHTEFRDPTATVSIFKDYMEYGNFSLGKFQVKGEASVVFIGNIDILGKVPHSKYEHLFEPLPEELVDTALFERIHGFIPGWEMPKLTDASFANGYGFTLDYFAELLHLLRTTLLPVDPATRYVLHHAKSRDAEAIQKIVRGLMKLLHPDGKATDAELAEYVVLAAECRQRVKDQLSIIAPGEYQQYTVECQLNGSRLPAAPPERTRRRALQLPRDPQIGVVVGLAVSGDTAGTIQLIEVIAQKGHGALNRLGSMGKNMKESVKAAYDFVSHRRKSLQIVTEFKDGYDLSVLALQGGVPKEGPSAGLAFAIGIVSVLTQRRVRNDVAVTGEITLHGNILGVGGLAQKIAAARDAGAKKVILPKENQREVEDYPPDVSRGLRLVFVEKADEAFQEAFL